MTDDMSLIQAWQDYQKEIETRRAEIQGYEQKQRELVEKIQEHIWVMNCGGVTVFAGTKEVVFEYASDRGQVPLDPDTEGACQFAANPMSRGIPVKIWGWAAKIKPVGHGYNWQELKEFAKRCEKGAGQ